MFCAHVGASDGRSRVQGGIAVIVHDVAAVRGLRNANVRLYGRGTADRELSIMASSVVEIARGCQIASS